MKNQEYLCTSCGAVNVPESDVKGSFLIEVILWLCFLVPGIIYSIWRLSSRYNYCPKCKGTAIIPADSPFAKNYMTEKKPQKKTLTDKDYNF